MMKAMTTMPARNPQAEKGFTIIELVVVILLLGILTATALPRFIDVTGEAQTAVRQAAAGGMQTGAALYRAEWFAEGGASGSQPGSFTLAANSTGYPAVSNGCSAIYTGLLQTGAPSISGTPTASGSQCTYTLLDGNGNSVGTITYDASDGSVQ